MDHAAQDAVTRFVADNAGYSARDLTPETTLLGDLGVDGDDAWELFEGFAKRFHVDLGNVDLTQHFHTEVELLCGPLDVAKLLWDRIRMRARTAADTSGKTPIRIRDLFEAVERGKWLTA